MVLWLSGCGFRILYITISINFGKQRRNGAGSETTCKLVQNHFHRIQQTIPQLRHTPMIVSAFAYISICIRFKLYTQEGRENKFLYLVRTLRHTL